MLSEELSPIARGTGEERCWVWMRQGHSGLETLSWGDFILCDSLHRIHETGVEFDGKT